ncbi:11379_t:CDS:10 [Acaulospora morrowiae]|uniref:11379_t:CDS:1 n=1 Tax=Acaulospora morrowiae TaxID=94023 RepID=A0A9N9F930_9GLOM|nr:11379_t:CDS:10 [Acaulospora morrowiae]
MSRPLGIDTINISPSRCEQKSPVTLPRSQILNPLKYLDETEEEYIDDLRCLVERVFTCWNRGNPPPSELGLMFHLISEIFKKNKDFHLRLRNISESQSTQGLADLLIKWAEEMEEPYSKYCQECRRDIDTWPEVEQHSPLQAVLNKLTTERNRPITLEFLLDIPVKRIGYYKKIYMRFSKIPEFGNFYQTHLIAANEKFEKIIELEKKVKSSPKSRISKTVHVQESQSTDNGSKDTLLAHQKSQNDSSELKNPTKVEKDSQIERKSSSNSLDSSRQDLDLSGRKKISSPEGKKISQEQKDTSNTVNAREWTLKEFEHQLDTSKVVDIFTNKPKQINIELLPSRLPFKRELILHDEFVVIFPGDKQRASNQKQAHVFLLTDLLLICQKKSLDEKKQSQSDKEFWLTYPPLSGRHISVCDDDKKDLITLKILKRENLILFTENKITSEKWSSEISNMVRFAVSLVGTRTQMGADKLQMLRKISSNPQIAIPTFNDAAKSPSGISLHNEPTNVANLRNESGEGLRKFLSVENLSPSSLDNGERSGKLNKSSSLSSLRSNDSSTSNSGSNLFPRERHKVSHNNSNEYLAPTHSALDLSSTPEPVTDNYIDHTKTLHAFHFCEISYHVENGNYKSITENKDDEFTVELRLTDTQRICLVALSEKDKKIVLQKLVDSKNSLIKKDSPFTVIISIKREIGKNDEVFKISLSTPGETEKLIEKFNDLILQNGKELIVPTKPQSSQPSSQFPQQYTSRPISPQSSPQFFPKQTSRPSSPFVPQPTLLAPTQVVSRSSSLQQIQQHQPVKNSRNQIREVEHQNSSIVLESQCKLFLKNDHGIWTNLGSGNMKLLLETPSRRKRVVVISEKNSTKLVDTIIWETGVEKVGKISIAITLNNIVGNAGNPPIVYMMQMKDKNVVNKVMDILKGRQKR